MTRAGRSSSSQSRARTRQTRSTWPSRESCPGKHDERHSPTGSGSRKSRSMSAGCASAGMERRWSIHGRSRGRASRRRPRHLRGVTDLSGGGLDRGRLSAPDRGDVEEAVSSLFSWLVGAAPPRAQLNPLDDRLYEPISMPRNRTATGLWVTPDTAMKVSAVYRCVSILANVLAMFPKGMFEKLDRGRREAPEHPLDPIISFRPNARQSGFEFWRQVCYHLVLRQNAYIQIVKGPDGRGWVGQLIPLNPDRIKGPEETATGRLRYEYRREDGQTYRMIAGDDLWHIQGLSSDGLRGLSMIDLAGDSIGVSMAAERHAARFFEKGVKPTGILEHPAHLKRETADEMSQSFTRKYGGEDGMGRVPVLWEGMQFKPISMTLKDAEFLDSRKFSVAEIARWFGVPPHMVGDVERSTSWGTGIEQQGLHFLIYSLQPWIELIEQSIRYWLVVQPERYYPKFNVSAILRMDAKTQADVLAIYLDKGVLNPNEARELLERNPREGGDEYAKSGTPAAPEPPPTQQMPMDDPPADGGEDNGMQERARALASASVQELLADEERALVKMAQEHAKDDAAWQEAMRRFYGRFAGRIAGTLACPKPAAKAWCDARRGLIASRGLVWIEEGRKEAAETLSGLALEDGGRPC